MSRTTRALAAITIAVAMLLFSALSPAADDEKCSECSGTGKVQCKVHKEPSKVRSTYEFDECPCHGFGWTPCTKCNEPKAKAEFETLVTDYNKWLEGRRDALDRNIFYQDWEQHVCGHVEGEHIIVCGTIRAGTLVVGPKKQRVKADAKTRAHTYLERSEQCFQEQFLPLLGLKSYTPGTKWSVTLWETETETLEASHRLVGNRQAPVATAEARTVTIQDKFPDEELHMTVVHNLIHLMLEEYKGFIDGGLPDWFWEATAHWAEYRAFGKVENNCNDEATPLENALHGDKLERRVKAMIKAKKCPTFSSFANLNVAKLHENERLMSWSLVDWLHKVYGPRKIELFVVICKRTKNQGQAFRDAFGLKYEELQEEWTTWVNENYK